MGGQQKTSIVASIVYAPNPHNITNKGKNIAPFALLYITRQPFFAEELRRQIHSTFTVHKMIRKQLIVWAKRTSLQRDTRDAQAEPRKKKAVGTDVEMGQFCPPYLDLLNHPVSFHCSQAPTQTKAWMQNFGKLQPLVVHFLVES